MYNMRPSLFCGGFKGNLKFVTGTYCELLTCIIVVVPVVGGVKGTKNALVVRGTSFHFYVYQRRRFVCVRLGD